MLGLATAHAEAFDQSQLRDVETEVKNTLPTSESEYNSRPLFLHYTDVSHIP